MTISTSNIETMLNSSLDDIKKSFKKDKNFKRVTKKGQRANRTNGNIVRNKKNNNNNKGLRKNNKFRDDVFFMNVDKPIKRNKMKNDMGNRILINARGNRNKNIKTIFKRKSDLSSNNLRKKPKKKLPPKPVLTESDLMGIKIVAKLDQTPEPLLAQRDIYIPLPESGSIPVPSNVQGTLNDKFTR